MTPTLTKPHTARKSELTITTYSAEPGMRVFVSIATDGKQSDYWFERIPSDFGIAVHVSKIWDGDAY